MWAHSHQRWAGSALCRSAIITTCAASLACRRLTCSIWIFEMQRVGLETLHGAQLGYVGTRLITSNQVPIVQEDLHRMTRPLRAHCALSTPRVKTMAQNGRLRWITDGGYARSQMSQTRARTSTAAGKIT